MIYCNSDNGKLYYMGTRLVGDVSWPPVTYTMSLGGDSSYGIGATSTYRGVEQTSTQVDTSYRQIPVYHSSVVSVKLTNKEGYRYNLNVSGLSATGSSRDTAYTYVTGIVTSDVSVSTAGLSLNTFTATSNYMTRYVDHLAENLYGGLIFYKSACTNPDAIREESSLQRCDITIMTGTDWYSLERSVYTTTFQNVLNGRMDYTAQMGYKKTINEREPCSQSIGCDANQDYGVNYIATFWSAGQYTFEHPGVVGIPTSYSPSFSYFSFDTRQYKETPDISWYKNDRVWFTGIFTGVLK